jgi:hypothetical protein
MRKLEHYTHPMIHPFYKLSKYSRNGFQKWRHYHLTRDVDPGCYGFFLLAQATRGQRAAQAAKMIQPKGAESVRVRPPWCSRKTWKNWRGYQREIACGIPLEDYADPVKRKAWLGKRIARDLTPREAAEALLRRKGFAP